jgi:UDP-N-acetylmuramoyl-tripeptide--D-alanyl-D-alanine ligase
MKKLAKPVVAYALSLIARLVIRRYKPQVVMVTGSVGKTSTRDAVAAALAQKFYLRKSQKSFNSEFGVPYTILDVGDPLSKPIEGLRLIKATIALLFLPNHYPRMLVLEVGADQPGDLAKVLKIVKPDAVVLTPLPEVPVHVEAYAGPEEVRLEEFSPALVLPAAAPLIVPADDAHATLLASRVSAARVTYGYNQSADIFLERAEFYIREGKVVGMQAGVEAGGEEEELVVEGSVGRTQLLPAAAALAAASAFGVSLTDALAGLKNYVPPAGRGRLLGGVNDSILIDDSYNASPIAVEEALRTLREFPGAKRRIAVLGDMLELGRYSVAEHERIGKIARESADIVASVGIRARVFTEGGAGAKVHTFDNSLAAGKTLRELARPGDVILIKGSQSIRTERVVEALLANPTDFSLLVRQDPAWKRRA